MREPRAPLAIDAKLDVTLPSGHSATLIGNGARATLAIEDWSALSGNAFPLGRSTWRRVARALATAGLSVRVTAGGRPVLELGQVRPHLWDRLLGLRHVRIGFIRSLSLWLAVRRLESFRSYAIWWIPL